jgi:TRAP-type C4-dicarboxylate transport system permease small subunit
LTTGSNDQRSIEELARSFDDEPEAVDLSDYAIEDWLTFIVFWGVVLCVILQFFTRYVLNDSFAWTEEVASTGLVCVVFLGAAMCVRRHSHIRVDLAQRLAPPMVSRLLELSIDLIVAVFFAYMTWLTWRYLAVAGGQTMISVDVSKSWLYYAVLAAFALMLARSLAKLRADFKSRPSVPEGANT